MLNLAELVERVLEFLLDGVEPIELHRFHPALVGADHGELGLGKPLKFGQIGFDDLMQVSCSKGAVADAGQKRIGPGLEQLLAMAGKLQLALEFLVGNARAAEIDVGFGSRPNKRAPPLRATLLAAGLR